MEDELQCIICLQTLKNPVTFLCQSHSVCKEPCMRQLYESAAMKTSTREGKTSIHCPICGSGEPGLLMSDADDVELNRTLCRIVALHLREEPPKQPEPLPSSELVLCEVCHGPAVVECLTCGCGLCQKHDESIHSAGVLSKHPRVPISAGSVNSRFCSEHPGKPRELLCLKDNQLVCSSCLLFGSHLGHQYHTIENAVRLRRRKVGEHKLLLEGRLTANRVRIDEINKRRDEMLRAKQAVDMLIDDRIDQLLEAVQQKRAVLKQDVQVAERNNSLQFDAAYNQIFAENQEIQDNIAETVRVMESCESNLYEFMDATNALEKKLEVIPRDTLSAKAPIVTDMWMGLDVSDLIAEVSALTLKQSMQVSPNSPLLSKQLQGYGTIPPSLGVSSERDPPHASTSTLLLLAKPAFAVPAPVERSASSAPVNTRVGPNFNPFVTKPSVFGQSSNMYSAPLSFGAVSDPKNNFRGTHSHTAASQGSSSPAMSPHSSAPSSPSARGAPVMSRKSIFGSVSSDSGAPKLTFASLASSSSPSSRSPSPSPKDSSRAHRFSK